MRYVYVKYIFNVVNSRKTYLYKLTRADDKYILRYIPKYLRGGHKSQTPPEKFLIGKINFTHYVIKY